MIIINDKKLYLSNNNKKLMGVCGGLGEYFDIDPTLIRIGFVVFTLLYGSGLLAYFIMGLVIPNEDAVK